MKQRWKKPLSWLLTLAMVFTMLPVMGVTARAAKADTRDEALILVAGDVYTPMDDCEDENQGWKWEKSTSSLDGSGTLTLTNVDFQVPSARPASGVRTGVCLPPNTTVELVGDNTITLTGRPYDDNDLSLPMDAIFGRGITFIGSGTLEINAAPTDSESYERLHGINCSGTLTIGDENNAPKITVTAGLGERTSQGIWAEKLSLQSGSLTATGGESAASYGIYTSELLNIAKDFAITASASTSSDAATKEACYFGYGYKDNSYDYKTADDYSWSRQSIADSVTGGTVTEKTDGVHVTQDGSDPVGIQYKGDIPKAQADSLDFTSATEDTSGEGWSWDNANKILSLNGLNLDVKNGALVAGIVNPPEGGIILPAGATIVLADGSTNQIRVTAAHTSDASVMEVFGIYMSGDLTIQGSGKLIVDVQLPSDTSAVHDRLALRGIGATGNLTIGTGTDRPIVEATAGDASSRSAGIDMKTDGYLKLLSGEVTVRSGDKVGNNSQFMSFGINGTLTQINDGFKVTASCGTGSAFLKAACSFGRSGEHSWTEDGFKKNLSNGTAEADQWSLQLKQSDSSQPLSFTYNVGGGEAQPNYYVYLTCGTVDEQGAFTEDSSVGTASATPNKAVSGTKIALTATPADGYRFKAWNVTQGNVTIAEDDTFTISEKNVKIQAVFEKVPTTPTDPGYTLDDGKLTIKNDDGMAAWIAFVQKPTGMYNVTSIEIQDGVTYIGEGVFSGLKNIESITIPASVTSIGDNAFLDCSKLAAVTVLGTAPASLGADVFKNTRFVTDSTKGITVPAGTLSAYQAGWPDWKDYMQDGPAPADPGYTLDADGHLTIKNDDGMAAWAIYENTTSPRPTVRSVTIEDGVTYIGEKAFVFGEFTSITIPESVTKIDMQAFNICSSLTSIKLPSKITSIGSYAFQSTGLTEITIPASVTDIYDSAFKYCSKLEKVTVLGETPAKLGGDVFSDTKFVTDSTKGITVPAGTLDAYQTADNWSAWKDYMQDGTAPAAYTVTVTSNNNDWGTASASPASAAESTEITLTAAAKDGYRFKEWKVVSGGVTITENKFTMPGGNVEIQAVFEEIPAPTPGTYTVSGTVTKDNSPVSGAKVELKGKGVTYPADTDPSGAYALSEVKNGLYNLIVTSGEQTVTVLVEVKDGDIRQNVALPSSGVSSKVEVRADAPAIAKDAVAGGLDAVAKANEDPNKKVEVKLELSRTSEGLSAIQRLSAAAKKILETIDLSVYKTVGADTSKITDTGSDLLKIVIPYDTARKGIAVFRCHDGAAQALTQLAANAAPSEGSFFVDTEHQCIIIYAGKFSTYAIGYTDPNSGSSGGGSSSGSSSSGGSYGIDVPAGIKGGSVSVSPRNAAKGSTVTVTVTPDKGYTLETLTVLDKDGKEVTLTEKDGRYTFTMPAGKVSVKASFMEDNAMLNFFTDVPASAYYYDAVLWAAEKGVTGGTSAVAFSPDAPCTRAQIVTFLWRAAGSPEPKALSSFSDVSADRYYAKAAAWAVENGIANGVKDGRFLPNAVCTRAQAVTFLHRASGAPAASGAGFSDVAANAYYAAAVAWASASGVTSGTKDGGFSPNTTCTRAQIVTFLYRAGVK